MRKVIVFNMITVDGYFCGPNGEIDWHNVDAEFNEFAIEQTKNMGTLLFGRTTYQLMADYWPMEQPRKNDPVVANLMNITPKIVFSRSMEKLQVIPHWENVSLMKEINKDSILKLKQSSAKDIAIYGSGQIVQEFSKLGLIDEYRLMVNPVILGKGKPLFKHDQKLKLLRSREFQNGNVLLCYQPDK